MTRRSNLIISLVVLGSILTSGQNKQSTDQVNDSTINSTNTVGETPINTVKDLLLKISMEMIENMHKIEKSGMRMMT